MTSRALEFLLFLAFIAGLLLIGGLFLWRLLEAIAGALA